VDTGSPIRTCAKNLADSAVAVSFLAERTVFPAFGIEGGQSGAPGAVRINGERVDPKRQYMLKRGDTVALATPGGGGHGAPRQRDAAALATDLAEGYVGEPAAFHRIR
jgi:N-methylhydantoinase B